MTVLPNYEILSQIDIDLFLNSGYVIQAGVEDVVILAHTHCLTSTYCLLKALVDSVGVPAQNIALLPKPYSTIPRTVRRLEARGVKVLAPNPPVGSDYDKSMTPYVKQICSWGQTQATKLGHRRRKARVILIDDGGILTRQWLRDTKRRSSFDVVSIQQTRSGVAVLGETPPLPVINVAQSAAKRKLSPFNRGCDHPQDHQTRPNKGCQRHRYFWAWHDRQSDCRRPSQAGTRSQGL